MAEIETKTFRFHIAEKMYEDKACCEPRQSNRPIIELVDEVHNLRQENERLRKTLHTIASMTRGY